MKVQKIAFAFLVTFFTLTGMTTPKSQHSLTINQCELLVELNNTMNEKLELTDIQLEFIMEFNNDYWSSRRNIINNPNMPGQNTALLACWDEWRIILDEKLTKSQTEKFMEWQSQVDLLGQTPF